MAPIFMNMIPFPQRLLALPVQYGMNAAGAQRAVAAQKVKAFRHNAVKPLTPATSSAACLAFLIATSDANENLTHPPQIRFAEADRKEKIMQFRKAVAATSLLPGAMVIEMRSVMVQYTSGSTFYSIGAQSTARKNGRSYLCGGEGREISRLQVTLERTALHGSRSGSNYPTSAR